MPVLKPGTQEYKDYYNAITLPGDTPPAQQQKAGGGDDGDSGGESKRLSDRDEYYASQPAVPPADVDKPYKAEEHTPRTEAGKAADARLRSDMQKAGAAQQQRALDESKAVSQEKKLLPQIVPGQSVGRWSVATENGPKTFMAISEEQALRQARSAGLHPTSARLVSVHTYTEEELAEALAKIRKRRTRASRRAEFEKAIKIGLIPANVEFETIGDRDWGYRIKPAETPSSRGASSARASLAMTRAPFTKARATGETQERGSGPFAGAQAQGSAIRLRAATELRDAVLGVSSSGTPVVRSADVDPTRVRPSGTSSVMGTALRNTLFLPYRNKGGTYDLAAAVNNPAILPSLLLKAGFTLDQIAVAQAAVMTQSLGVQQSKVLMAGCCPTSLSQTERVDALAKVMAFVHERMEQKQESATQAVAAALRESARTHVAMPGEERAWYHWPTGRTISDSEYRQVTNNGRNAKAEEYSRAAPQVRRGAIEAVSAFMFLSARAALPERAVSQETVLDYAVSTAQLATWALPFVPKGVGGAMAGGAGAIFGVNTAQHWDDMSTTGKVVSVAATALLLTSSVHALVQPSFEPVKVPLKDGTEAVVWSGLSVRGKPVIGITKLPPNIGKVAEGWRPITKTETSVLGTRKMLEKMGVPDDEITKVLTTVEETKAFQGMRSPHEPSKVKVEDVAPQALTPDELAVVLKRLAQNKGKVQMVYGSTTIKPQLAPKLRNWRKLGDIEAQLKAGVTEKDAAQLAKDIVDDLNKKQPGKFSIDPADAKRILVRDHHAVELKLSEVSKLGVETQYSLTRTGEMSWGMKVAEKPISVEYPGIGTLDIMRLSESGVRKADSITRAAEGGTFAPPAHRVKDIADYYVILYTFKGEKTANAWAKLYGFNADDLLAAAAKDPPKLEAWRFTPGKTTATSSPTVRVSLPQDMAAAVQSSSPALYRDITAPMSSPALASSMAVRTSPAAMIYAAARASASTRFTPSAGKGSPSPVLRGSSSAIAAVSPGTKPSPGSASGPGLPPSPPPGGSARGTSSGIPDAPPPPPPDSPPPPPPSSPPPPPPPPDTPKGTKPVKRTKRGAAIDKKGSDSTGRVQWKQGAYWVMVEPPAVEGEVQRNVYYSRRPFWGVRVVKGNPERTFSVQGNPPKQFLYRMGIVQADIFTREKPHLRYRQTGAGRGNNRKRRGRLQR